MSWVDLRALAVWPGVRPGGPPKAEPGVGLTPGQRHPGAALILILRHSKIAVTMEIYTEVPSAATRDALGKLAQWLDPDS